MKDPRWGYRSDRTENSAPTQDEFDSKKNIGAITHAGELLTERHKEEERQIKNKVESVDCPGNVVKTMKPFCVANDTLIADSIGRTGTFILPEGSIGLYVDKTRQRSTSVMMGRHLTIDLVTYDYVFEGRVVHFGTNSLRFLEKVS